MHQYPINKQVSRTVPRAFRKRKIMSTWPQSHACAVYPDQYGQSYKVHNLGRKQYIFKYIKLSCQYQCEPVWCIDIRFAPRTSCEDFDWQDSQRHYSHVFVTLPLERTTFAENLKFEYEQKMMPLKTFTEVLQNTSVQF